MGIRFRIVAGLMGFALLSAAATAYLFHRAMPVLEQPAYDRVIENARQLDEKINHTLFTYYTEAQQFAATPTTADPENWANTVPTNNLVAAMNADMKKDENYRVALYLDLAGKVRAVSTQSPKGKPVPTDGYYAQNFSTADWFTHARDGKFLEGKSGATGTVITGPLRDGNVAKAYGDDGYVLVFASPVKDAAGKIVGIWANFVSFELVENVLVQQDEAYKNQGLAHTQITLLDASGTVVAEVNPSAGVDGRLRDFEVIGKQNLVAQNYPPATEAMSGKSGASLVPALDGKGATQLVGFYHSEEIFTAPGLGWTVLVRFDKNEIFAAIHHATQQVVQGIAAVMAGMLVLALLVSGSIAKRARLQRAALEETVPAKLTAQREEMAEWFETTLPPITKEMAEDTKTVHAQVEKLQAAASDAKARSSNLARGINDSARQLKLANGTAKKLGAAMQELGQQLQKSAGAANKVGMQAESVQHTAGAMTKESEALQAVLGLLASIAKHSNLLALNATIEAARAGDAGKGLGDIATQIKALSGEAQAASDALTNQMRVLQSASGQLGGYATAMTETVAQLGASTKPLIEHVAQHQVAGSEIARQLEELSTGATALNDDGAQVETALGDTGSATKLLLAEVEKIEAHTTKLADKSDAFLAVMRDKTPR